MVKKALLFQALERELGIELPARETAAAGDISALAQLVFRAKAEGKRERE